jgi:hypothetical protein
LPALHDAIFQRNPGISVTDASIDCPTDWPMLLKAALIGIQIP